MPRPGRPWVETDPTENWASVSDPKIRRRLQNRLNARAHRRRRALEREAESVAQSTKSQTPPLSSSSSSQSVPRTPLQVRQYIHHQSPQMQRKRSQQSHGTPQSQHSQQSHQHQFYYGDSLSLPAPSRNASPSLSEASSTPSSPASTQIADLPRASIPAGAWDYFSPSQSTSSSYSAVYPDAYAQFQADPALQQAYSSPTAPARLRPEMTYSAPPTTAAAVATAPIPIPHSQAYATAAVTSDATRMAAAVAAPSQPPSSAAMALLSLSAPSTTACSTWEYQEAATAAATAAAGATTTTSLQEWMIPWDAAWLAAAGQEMENPFTVPMYPGAGAGVGVGAGSRSMQDGAHRGSVDVFSDSTLSTQGSPGPDVFVQGDYVGF